MGLFSFFKGKDNKEDLSECHIKINVEDCDACGKCCTACQNNVLIIRDGVVRVRDSQVCRNCKVCMAICPNDCIEVN